MRLLRGITTIFTKPTATAVATAVLAGWLQMLLPADAWAQATNDDRSGYQKSLDDVSREINRVTENLNENRKLLKSERDKLATLEQRMAQLRKQREQTQSQINQQREELADLERQLQYLNQSQASNKTLLQQLILHRYKSGDPNYLKLLLNQENPYEVGRLNHYYRYFSAAQKERLSLLSQQLDEVRAVRRLATQKSAELAATEQKLVSESQTLQSLTQQREQRVASLDGQVSEEAAKLEKLESDRNRLNKLLEQIAEQARKLRELEAQRQREAAANRNTATGGGNQSQRPRRPLVAGGFRKQRGRLTPPVAASLAYGFGSRLAQSGMPAQGHFYNTSENDDVVAVFRGRVLFADYLKGYGLLLIIDHGDEHISLYGHNELLYKRVGDSVTTGEVVAKSGVSGGLKRPGLYFEIRHNAVPVDPKQWLSN